MGPANAPVRILEFSDFQCRYCAELQPTLRAIRAKYPDRVAVVYRHFPVADHPHATQAALASECAAAQGQFERFHDLLFATPDSIGVTTWDQFARRAGIPMIDSFRVCVGTKKYQPKVEQDVAAARSIAAPGTPTLLVNGRMFSHNPSPKELDDEVRRALRNAPLARQ
jgi:protein-disulfide isomerase